MHRPILARLVPHALEHAAPEHKANSIGPKAVKQNGNAQKHEAPGQMATEAGLRGGGSCQRAGPQDFSTRCYKTPVHTASPNPPGDSLGVLGGGGVLGLSNSEVTRPLHLREIGKNGCFAPQASPGLFEKSPPPYRRKPPGIPKSPPLFQPEAQETYFPAHP